MTFWWLGAAPIALLFALPLSASLIFALRGAFDADAWHALLQHPQLWKGLWLSLYTGAISAALALITALVIVSGTYQSARWKNLTATMGAMLALPHLGMAIGLGFLIMPSGILARLIAAMFTGWQVPPQWITTHDPFGLALIAALVIKETPFLVWILAGMLNRDDMRRNFAAYQAAALSLGHGTGSIWLRIFLPQLMPKLIWPLLIVFVYAATVVDMSLAIGPTQPPTLSNIIWADINSDLVASNARGLAGAIFLSLALMVFGGLAGMLVKLAQPMWHSFISHGPSLWHLPKFVGQAKVSTLTSFYVLATILLLFMSLAQFWPFPDVLPTTSGHAWAQLMDHPRALMTSLMLALTTSATALVIIIVWLETMPPKNDRLVLVMALAMLGLPPILVGLGQYRAFLEAGLTANAFGLFLAHLMPVTAYMLIVLVGPYRALDARYAATASGLLASPLKFLLKVKWPLLKAPILSSAAVGFAVSFGQFIPAQLIGSGRFTTLPVEAVTLTSGTNRPLTAAFALLLLLPPLVAYVGAAQLGRPRWKTA